MPIVHAGQGGKADVSYQLVIGNKNISSWSLRPWLAMRQAGLTFSEINIKLRQPDTPANILRHSPSGKIPALLTQGQVIWDSLAILEFLAEAHPAAGLWPADAKARARARSVAAEMHSGFAPLRDHCPMELLARLPMTTLPDPVADNVRRIVALWADCRRTYGTGGPFLFGAFTAADAMYAPVATRFRTYLPDLARWGDDGTAQAYVDAIFALPAMAEWEAGARRETAAQT
jgi:glutathione S-transferase